MTLKTVRLLFGLFVMAGSLVLLYDFAIDRRLRLLGFGEAAESNGAPLPLADAVLCAVVMLLGLCMGTVYERIKERKTRVVFWRELKRALTSAAFFRALLASPLVYSAVYIAAKTQPDAVIALVFAFENGFLCEALLRERKATG